MSIQCLDCGSLIMKGGFKTHQKTDKCIRIQEFNKKYQFKCRKCGLYLEKQWHAESHHCDGVKVYNPEIEELKLRCKFYVEFISAMGVKLDIDWEMVKNGTFTIPIPPKVYLKYKSDGETEESDESDESESDESDESESESDETEVPPTPPTPIINSVPPPVSNVPPIPHSVPPVPHSVSHIIEKANHDFSEAETSIQGLIALLLKGNRESADGEDRYYILGNKLGEFINREYPRQSDSKIANVFKEVRKLTDKISNTIDEREQFINGLHDSFCGSNIVTYTLLNLDMLDQSLQLDPTSLLKMKGVVQNITLMNLNDIAKSYSIVYGMLPIEEFINAILIHPLSQRYCYVHEQFYRKEEAGYTVDPWMLDLTAVLSNSILEICVPLFKKVYKLVYGNNVYRDDWDLQPFLKQFKQVYKNIEIASTVFDLNHTLRKVICQSKGNTLEIQPMKTSQVRNEEWALMSTRINAGIPGFDMSNFYDILFTNDPSSNSSSMSEISSKWLEKYLKKLKSLSSEYTSSSRFRAQVQAEMEQY